MSENNKVLLIPKIEKGIVIDHIPAGEGKKILEIIHSYPEMKSIVVTLGINYSSKKLGRKDMIKLQMDFLAPEIIQQISLVVPGVTIKAVKNYMVNNKIVIQPPKEIKNLLGCRNPNCITNFEKHLETSFTIVDEKTKKVKCNYCERIFKLSELNPIN